MHRLTHVPRHKRSIALIHAVRANQTSVGSSSRLATASEGAPVEGDAVEGAAPVDCAAVEGKAVEGA